LDSVALTGPTWNDPAHAAVMAEKKSARPKAAWRMEHPSIIRT
jgi:hypothetical protein